MPLPSDERIVQLANDILKQFETIFGPHPGFRPAHAKGLLVTGRFTPSQAGSLTRAPHATQSSTPVSVRFSNATGLPAIADNDPNAGPRGLAIRFHLGEHVHTDIIGHSTDGFPTRTGQEFLEFFRAVGASGPGQPSPTPIETYLGSHPAALRFVQAPKPSPVSFATEAFFGVTAFRFTNGDGVSRYGRYRIVPKAGLAHLDDAVAKARDPDHLFTELTQRVASSPVEFNIEVQIASEGDVVDDATVSWPADRPVIPFGTLVLAAVAGNNASEQQHIIFDPIPRVDGIEASADPLLELRAAVYLISGRRRRQAPEVATSTAETAAR